MVSKSQLKYIQSLGQKKHRDDEGLFIAEGPKVVREFLQDPHVEVKSLYALNDWVVQNENLLARIDPVVITESELGRMSQLKTPNQVLAVVKKFEWPQPATKGKLSLALETIQDPGNVGTIVRIADWFGVSQIICSDDCADVYNPKVVQATMGSIARVNVFYCDFLAWLKTQIDVRIYAALLEGKDVTKMSPLKEGLVIIGNESKGISEEVLQLVNERITIPKKGKAESLNAAVAAGIILSRLA